MRQSFSFQPIPFWFSLFSLLAFMALIALGVWQLFRLQEKTDYINVLHARIALSPTPINALGDDWQADDWLFMPVTLQGEFLHEGEIHVSRRDLNGKEGMHIFTPFRLQNNGGQNTGEHNTQDNVILVNRGYVPFPLKEREARPQSLTNGMVNLYGLMAYNRNMPLIRGWVLPKPDLDKNFWYGLDIDAINAKLQTSYPKFYVMDANTDIEGGFPKGKQWKLDVQNDHLEYAITWFTLSLGLLGIYIAYVRKWRESHVG